jgi:hypothetical protein
MKNAHYSTADDYFAALELKEKIKHILNSAKGYIILSSAEYSIDCIEADSFKRESFPLLLIGEIEQVLGEIE